jgi:MFS family permease
MTRTFAIERGSWADFFIKREIDFIPRGRDRMLTIALIVALNFAGNFAVQYGPIAAPLLKSEDLSLALYGQTVAVTGLAVALFGIIRGQLADRHSRVRLFLWNMLAAIVFHFAMAFLPDHQTNTWIVLYFLQAWTESWSIALLLPLIRDFSPQDTRSGGNWLELQLGGGWRVLDPRGRLLPAGEGSCLRARAGHRVVCRGGDGAARRSQS